MNYLTNHTTGAAYPAVHPEDFENAKLPRPPDALLCRFHEAVASMLQQVRVLEARNANLRRTRDLVLPKLVSGEIDVSDLECAT